MELKRIVRYRLDFDRKWLTASGALMGIALFLQVLHYFAVVSISQVTTPTLVRNLILPLILEAAWFLLLRGFRLNAPGVYGILGSLFAALMIIQTFANGSVFSGLIALVSLVLCAVALLAITGGYLRFRFVGVVVLLGSIVLRLLFGGLEQKLLEAALLCDMAAILLFFGGLEVSEKDRDT